MSFLLKYQWRYLNLSMMDAILTVSMNRPKANAMSTEFLHELIDVFNHASNDQQIRGILLRFLFRNVPLVSSSTFSAGADLSTVYQLAKAGQRSSIDEFIFHSLNRGITSPIYCSKPVACSQWSYHCWWFNVSSCL